MAIVVLALAGLLIGGAWSLYQQGRSRSMVALIGGLGILAVAGGVLWL